MLVDIFAIGNMCCAAEMSGDVSTSLARRVIVRCTFAFGFADETLRVARVTDLLIRFAILLVYYSYALTFRTVIK